MSSRKRKKAPFLDRNTKKMIRRVFAIDVSTPRLRGRPATAESAHACFELLEDEVDMMARCVKHREAVFSESKESGRSLCFSKRSGRSLRAPIRYDSLNPDDVFQSPPPFSKMLQASVLPKVVIFYPVILFNLIVLLLSSAN
jgi:hypothetical protein